MVDKEVIDSLSEVDKHIVLTSIKNLKSANLLELQQKADAEKLAKVFTDSTVGELAQEIIAMRTRNRYLATFLSLAD